MGSSDRQSGGVIALPGIQALILMRDQRREYTHRVGVHDIRIAGRNTQGVKLFTTEPDEHVVSSARLSEAEAGDDDEG